MFDFLHYAFMQRAFLAGAIVALLCPTIGIYLVLRRLSMVGNMFSHVSLAGVALGIFTGTYPLAAALALSLAAAATLEALRRTYRFFSDLAIAIIISAGISLAVILISLSRALNTDLFSYLFGSVIAISAQDLYLIAVVGSFVLLTVFVLQKELFYIAFDEAGARAAGIRVDLVNMLFVLATSLTIAVTMRVVGALLVSSLLTVPVAAALQVGKSFRSTVFWSYLIALVSVFSGLVVAYYADLAPGGSIVMCALVIFVLSIIYGRGSGRKHHAGN
ncbi:MAG: metal ABC transporter permease [Firmicutes bacterium]|jgi:zinc transport system permease protein|nr:metal ABC transporter permease [Bacillota bacterium]